MGSEIIDDCLLTTDQATGCQDFTVGGLNTTLYFLNFRDYVSKAPDATYPKSAIKDFTTKTGAYGLLKVEGLINTAGADAALQGMKGAGSLNFQAGLVVTIPNMTAKIIDFLLTAAHGQFIIFFRSRYENDAVDPVQKEARLFVVGIPNGLTIETLTPNFGLAQTDLVGTPLRFSDAQTSPWLEVLPDPSVYTSDTPIYEFIQAKLENPD